MASSARMAPSTALDRQSGRKSVFGFRPMAKKPVRVDLLTVQRQILQNETGYALIAQYFYNPAVCQNADILRLEQLTQSGLLGGKIRPPVDQIDGF